MGTILFTCHTTKSALNDDTHWNIYFESKQVISKSISTSSIDTSYANTITLCLLFKYSIPTLNISTLRGGTQTSIWIRHIFLLVQLFEAYGETIEANVEIVKTLENYVEFKLNFHYLYVM